MRKQGHQTMQLKTEVIEFVDRQVELGRKIGDVLSSLEVSRSTFYHWKKEPQEPISKTVRNINRKITPAEEQIVLKAKADHPQCRHRQIQGIIQNMGAYISPSSVFKILKKHQLVEPFERREAPWKQSRYEIPKRHLMWGADWTKIKINHVSWHLLTVIDFFSRYIVGHLITPEVNSSHVKQAYQLALLSENIADNPIKPRLRVDQGAPNKSKVTKAFFVDMALDLLSLARVRRPTDNAITERFYGTLKQEEVYLVGSYPDEHAARKEIEAYIKYYNTERPHQALWNFTPKMIHLANNKSQNLAQLESLKYESKLRRREYWALKNELEFKLKLADGQAALH